MKPATRPDVHAFFDEATNTVTYVAKDPQSTACAIIDSVLDFMRRIDATAMLDAAHLDQHQLNLQDPQRPVLFVLVARWSVAEPAPIGSAGFEGGSDPASDGPAKRAVP